MSLCLTLSIIRYGLRVKWVNPWKGVAPYPTIWCSSYQKGAFGSPSTTVANFIFYMVSDIYCYVIIIIIKCLDAVIWYQFFFTNDFQTGLFDP